MMLWYLMKKTWTKNEVGVGLDLVCVCVSIVQTMNMHLEPLEWALKVYYGLIILN